MPQWNDYGSPLLPLTGTETFLADQNGNPVNPTLFEMVAKMNVADLPTSGVTQGAIAYALDGRNSGEGVGAGTGCLVTYNKNGVWAAVWSGAQVEA